MQFADDFADDDDASSLGSKSYGGLAEGGGGGGGNATSHALPRILTAGEELESLCRTEIAGGHGQLRTRGFPHTCLPIVGVLPGNHCCCDCGDEDRDRLRYASVGYGEGNEQTSTAPAMDGCSHVVSLFDVCL